MQGRPFVLLGVNNDEDREEIQRVADKLNLPWRSWWDGPENRIAKDWGVQGWPTVFLIDHQGKIRDYNLRGRELDEAVEKLVRAAETSKR